MNCPFRVIAEACLSLEKRDRGDWVNPSCEQANCGFWIERFGQCALAVDAYLKGQADISAERRMKD